MTVPRKIGPHGRTTNVVAGKRFRKALNFPHGVGWCVPLPRDLLNSPAWLAMSHQCRKLVDALMAEHADHGGLENGNLLVPYDTLQTRGIRRGNILNAIFEAEALRDRGPHAWSAMLRFAQSAFAISPDLARYA